MDLEFRNFKISLFSSQDFDFFKTPEFLGSEFLLAVAHQEIPPTIEISIPKTYLSFVEVPPVNRQNQESLAADLLRGLCDDLVGKLPPEASVNALFDTRAQKPAIWTWKSFKALRFTGDTPLPILRAQEIVRNFLLLKHKERAMLAPEIDWQQSNPTFHSENLERKTLRKFYDQNNPQIKASLVEIDRKKKILVHVCCGPDAAGVIDQLSGEFDVVCFWYDPNIQPKAEHDLRLAAFQKVVELKKVAAIVGEYDVAHFLESIRGLEHTPEQGAKCSICYDLRLERAVIEAKKQNCDLFTTTLAISPHKVQQKLKNFGETLAKKHGVPYLARNFMKHEGFKESVVFTNQNEIYRQDYCGCWFSLHEGGAQAQKLAAELGLTKEEIESKNFEIPFEQS